MNPRLVAPFLTLQYLLVLTFVLISLCLDQLFWELSILANGFLPTRGSFMLDTVFLAMFAIITVMLLSVYLVRVQRKAKLHRKIQIILASVLVVAIVAFEIDVRFVTDWRALAEESPYYASGAVDFWLLFHLCFAIPTPFVWMVVILKAMKHFSAEGSGSLGNHASSHRTWGKIAAGLMAMTAITGCIFYWISFVA